ncbi:hypothetical protein PIB30_045143 [Stylosanthes scabra]|uniref:Uncharacterized protein n=1 Tax=Stylosanthes scabra TaxID=79078 RepID=A0ABU6UFR8_9FABA|nr:hypothetical protein [Stylosanthes scabra]
MSSATNTSRVSKTLKHAIHSSIAHKQGGSHVSVRNGNSRKTGFYSSCVGLLPAPDDYLGSSPSMVHHCRMSWASATQSGHVPSARTCSTPKSLQLELVA